MDVFNFPKQWLLVCLTIGLISHYFASGRTEKLDKDKFSLFINILLCAITISMGISALISNTTFVRSMFGYPGRANGVLTYICILSIVWVASRTLLMHDFQQKIQNRLNVLFLIFGLYSTLQVLNLDPVPWNNPYNRVIGTLGNPNFSGAFLGVASAAISYAALNSRRRIRWIYAAFAIWLLGLAISTQSIQAFGIFIIGILLQIAILVYKRFSPKLFLSFVFSFIAIASFFAIGLLGYGPFGEKLYQYTLRLRLEYWRIGLETARDFPFTGKGPDSYIEGFRLYRGSEFVGKYSQEVISDSAHNVLINFMANYGIPAFILFTVLIGAISWKSIKLLFSKKTVPTGTQMLAIIWILMLIQSLFSLEQIGLNIFQWVCGALVLNKGIYDSTSAEKKVIPTSRKANPNFIQGLRTEISILAIVLSMIIGWSFMKQEIAILKIASISQGSKLNETEIQNYLAALNFFSKDEIRRAIYLSDFYLRIEKLGDSQVLMEEITRKDPDAVEAFEQLARLARFSKDLNRELEYRKEIERLDPFNYENLLSLAHASAEMSKSSEAISYAKKVLSMSTDKTINESATVILQNSK